MRPQLRDIATYLERSRPGYGRLFVDAVESVIRRIEEFPDSFAALPERPQVRRALVGTPFNKFGVFFRSGEDESTVLAVLHSARRLDAWH